MQRVLVLQSATPVYVRRAIESILAKDVLGPARITVFTRALPDEQVQFQGLPWIDERIIHDEARGALGHLRGIRRRRFDVVVVFFTGDPSYWKVKWFAFLCGARHLLIFNEHLGCFYFTPGAFLAFCRSRLREWHLRKKQKLGYALGTSQGFLGQPSSLAISVLRPFHLTLKVALFPLRFVYLLISTAYRQSRRRSYLRRPNATI